MVPGCVLLKMRNILHKSSEEDQNTKFILIFFNLAIYDLRKKRGTAA
jgi:hypothetical protein